MTDPHVSPHTTVIEIDLAREQLDELGQEYAREALDTMDTDQRREWLRANGLGWLEDEA